MSYTLDVDVGGTFMDFFARGDDKFITAKVPTTKYEVGVGFLKGIEELAMKLGVSTEEFLTDTMVIRYSTTLGTNAMLESKGPKLGLITTAGHEDMIFIGRARQWADGLQPHEVRDMTQIDKPTPLIPRKMVVGIRERLDCFGKVAIPIVKEEILEKIRYLVDNGARGFVVSLLWSFLNPVHEKEIKSIIEEEYPEAYLGNMPIILSSEISPKAGEYTRTMTAVVNGYMHSDLAEQLSSLVENLRQRGYKKPVLLMHNTGGCQKISRSIAINSHNASPVAGLCGALYMSKLCRLPKVVYGDVGGTSFDIGVIVDNKIPFYELFPVVERWRTQLRTIETRSIGAGGGSIAWLNPLFNNRLEVGPLSAGAMPGPVCFDLGGEEATVTDADLVLGYLDPDYFLGGRMKLNKEKAVTAIEGIGSKLGTGVNETAALIKRVIDTKMGQEIFKRLALGGYDPKEFTMFACGGGGASHCCGFGYSTGIKKFLVPPYSATFGAFGGSTLNIKHVYDKSRHFKMFDFNTQRYFSDLEAYNSIVRQLSELALNDMRLEGFKDEDVSFTLELEMRYGMQYQYMRVQSPLLYINEEEDVIKICDTFTNEYGNIYGRESAYPAGGIEIETFMLTAQVPVGSNLAMPEYKLEDSTPPKEAYKSQRDAYWIEIGGTQKTNVYKMEALRPGNILEGPAIIEAENTTCVVPPGWRYELDKFRIGHIDLINK